MMELLVESSHGVGVAFVGVTNNVPVQLIPSREELALVIIQAVSRGYIFFRTQS